MADNGTVLYVIFALIAFINFFILPKVINSYLKPWLFGQELFEAYKEFEKSLNPELFGFHPEIFGN